MITEEQTYHCRKCQSTNVRRNGYNKAKSELYHCYDCNFYGVMYPKVKYTEERKEEIRKALLGALCALGDLCVRSSLIRGCSLRGG